MFKKSIIHVGNHGSQNGSFPWGISISTYQAFFEAIEVNAVDAWTLFDSLDADGDHLVSYEEPKLLHLGCYAAVGVFVSGWWPWISRFRRKKGAKPWRFNPSEGKKTGN